MAVLPNLSDNMKESTFNKFFIQYILVNSWHFLGNVWMFETFFVVDFGGAPLYFEQLVKLSPENRTDPLPDCTCT